MTDTPSTPEPEPAAPPPPEPAVAPAAAAAPAAPPAATAPPPARSGGGGLVILVILLILLMLGGGGAAAWFLYLPTHPMPALAKLLPFLPHAQPAPGTMPLSAAPVAAAPGPAAVAPPAVSAAPASAIPAAAAPAVAMSSAPPAPALAGQVQLAAAGLVADAQRYGLPREQIGALNTANGQLATAGPDQANGLAMTMARNEASMLGRAAQVHEREVEGNLGGWGGGGGALGTVRRARGNLAAATVAVSQAPDGVTAIAAARRAAAAYAAFSNAYAAATRYYAPAKRAQFYAVAGQARAYAGQVVALSGATEVGLFATTGRREAYDELQSNAARARSQIAQLSQLAEFEGGESDLRELDANLDRAKAINRNLYGLYGVSNALYQANK